MAILKQEISKDVHKSLFKAMSMDLLTHIVKTDYLECKQLAKNEITKRAYKHYKNDGLGD